eukprot:Blabericola_migrator_1__8017@NODE_4113_length_1325_cov_131_600159_g2545_i0_p1_GENE_NODE_4113_length_1325_cov_131_600159_g2545_i0NODE_4113_length_1325_cov_131_600159_g2545_i0_p1_ORF_typecomplete_len328_score51_33Fbox/PF00646_33/0_058_NODE_4113_length_1325_cov_131_600159_g2545_i01591142
MKRRLNQPTLYQKCRRARRSEVTIHTHHVYTSTHTHTQHSILVHTPGLIESILKFVTTVQRLAMLQVSRSFYKCIFGEFLERSAMLELLYLSPLFRHTPTQSNIGSLNWHKLLDIMWQVNRRSLTLRKETQSCDTGNTLPSHKGYVYAVATHNRAEAIGHWWERWDTTRTLHFMQRLKTLAAKQTLTARLSFVEFIRWLTVSRDVCVTHWRDRYVEDIESREMVGPESRSVHLDAHTQGLGNSSVWKIFSWQYVSSPWVSPCFDERAFKREWLTTLAKTHVLPELFRLGFRIEECKLPGVEFCRGKDCFLKLNGNGQYCVASAGWGV